MNKFITIVLLLIGNVLQAQSAEIYGTVVTASGQPILGANIIIENTLIGTATDSRGNYVIGNVTNGDLIISASAIGFSKKSLTVSAGANQRIELNFQLKAKSYQFDQLVITANKYATEISEIAASTYVLDQKLFSEKSIRQIDDALRLVPGINMISDQISIRGSSGYGRGAGTRVLVAIDGIPIYSPDSGDIIWELVPITEIGSVEILKGSASSLYGSSAIGGVVNIITKEISSNPITYVKLYGGVYSNPSHEQWRWTDKTLSFNSQTISHSRTIGKLSLSGSLTRHEDYSYRKNDYQLRFAGFFKANYKFSDFTSLSFLGTGYTRDKNTFNYWRDIQNALSPPLETIGEYIGSDRTILGLTLNHILNNNFSFSFIPSAYISYWKENGENSNRSNSKLYRSEFRTNYHYSENLNFVSGLEIQYNTVASNIFGDQVSNGLGLYSQADYKLNTSIKLSLGLRYDYNEIDKLESTQSLSPKIGITYQLSSATFFRGLVSKGFRAPSLAEAFTSTTSAGITIKPNPNIQSETSYSFELGANHIITENLAVDISLFNNEYFDMIEPGFDPNDGQVFFSNVTRARIQGTDLHIKFSPFQDSNIDLGYTYLWARDIEQNKLLKYRSKHSFLIGFDYSKNLYNFGFDFRFLSRFDTIDEELVDLGVVPDGDKRTDIYVLNINAGLNLFLYKIPCRLFVNVNNLLNYNYVELIGNIAPIRNYSLNIEWIF